MPTLSEQPDLLRALGRTMDEQHGTAIEIIIHEAFLAVSWQVPGQGPEQRSLREVDLETLRDQARLLRGGAVDPHPGATAEMLRTLGQALSADQLEASSINEEQEGFRVSGIADGRYTQKVYSKAELRRQSEKRRATRGGRTYTSLSARLGKNKPA
jgi:hypothetical protein